MDEYGMTPADWAGLGVDVGSGTGTTSGGIDTFGLGGTLDYMLKTAADTYKAKTLIQQNQQGLKYLEGQPGIFGTPYGYGTAGGGGLLMLLLIAGGVYLVAKG